MAYNPLGQRPARQTLYGFLNELVPLNSSVEMGIISKELMSNRCDYKCGYIEQKLCDNHSQTKIHNVLLLKSERCNLVMSMQSNMNRISQRN